LQHYDRTEGVGHLEEGWNQVGRMGECTGLGPADTLDATVAESDSSAMDLSAIKYQTFTEEVCTIYSCRNLF
jgi:hypothetical protein